MTQRVVWASADHLRLPGEQEGKRNDRGSFGGASKIEVLAGPVQFFCGAFGGRTENRASSAPQPRRGVPKQLDAPDHRVWDVSLLQNAVEGTSSIRF